MSIFVILALMLAPVIAVLLLRSNSALVFAALCVGFTVTHYVSSHQVGVQLAPYIGPAKDDHIQLVLAFLPAIVVLFATMSSQAKGLASKAINTLPALGVGFLTIALALPFMTGELYGDILSSSLWHTAVDMQAPIIGFAALASLILLVRGHYGRTKPRLK